MSYKNLKQILSGIERKSSREIMNYAANLGRKAVEYAKENAGNAAKIGVGLGAVGLVAFVNEGCGNMSRREKEAWFFGTMGAFSGYRANELANQGDLQGAANAAALSDMNKMISNQQGRMAAAEAGKSDVNININNNGGQNTLQYPPFKLFTCVNSDYCEGNNPNPNVQTTFHPRDKIYSCAYSCPAGFIQNYLINNDTKETYKIKDKGQQTAGRLVWGQFDATALFTAGKSFTNVWLQDGKEIGRLTFYIEEKKK